MYKQQPFIGRSWAWSRIFGLRCTVFCIIRFLPGPGMAEAWLSSVLQCGFFVVCYHRKQFFRVGRVTSSKALDQKKQLIFLIFQVRVACEPWNTFSLVLFSMGSLFVAGCLLALLFSLEVCAAATLTLKELSTINHLFCLIHGRLLAALFLVVCWFMGWTGHYDKSRGVLVPCRAGALSWDCCGFSCIYFSACAFPSSAMLMF